MKYHDIIVCFDDSNQTEEVLKMGKKYTIIGFTKDKKGVFLREARNAGYKSNPHGKEINWHGHKIERFKKLDLDFAEDVISYIKHKVHS